MAGNRSDSIEKGGAYDKNTGLIDWKITVNKSGGQIEEAIVKDMLPESLTLVPGSITVTKLDSDGKNPETIDIDEDNFPINLDKIESNEYYEIHFSTSIDYSEVNGGEYQLTNEFINTTVLFDGENQIDEDDKTVSIIRDPILEKVEVGNVDYENRTITWKVTVNKAKHPLGAVTVTDYLPEGLHLESVGINGEDGEPFEDAKYSTEDVTVGEHAKKTKLTIDLQIVGTETITIKYTTSIKDFSINNFVNTVGMTGVGVGEGGDTVNVCLI